MTHSSSSFRLRPLSVVILTGAGNLTSTGAANLERRTDVGVGYIATRGDAGDQRSLLRTDLSDRRSDPSIEFNNSGTVAVDAGVLNLGGDGTHTGSFNIGVDRLLAFTGGKHTFAASSSLTGFTFAGADLTTAGTYDVMARSTGSGRGGVCA